MNAYDFVHLALHALGGEIRGKTKLQKTIYFLGALTRSLADLGYRPHYYGPYSADVGGAVDRLRALGFVDQTVSSGGACDSSGFEVARYDFRLNEEGKRVAEAKAKNNPEFWAKLNDAVQTFKRAGEEDYMKLSVAAKTNFMLGENKGPARSEDLIDLARRFGWAVTPDQVQEAAHFLHALGLVRLVDFP
jgi:uncharacterized protein YwgA